MLQTSHVAAKLNGYLVGVGGSAQFMEEASKLGLTEKQIDYVYRHAKDNEGGALYCWRTGNAGKKCTRIDVRKIKYTEK